MTRHYTHTSELAAGLAVCALPSVMGGTSTPAMPPADPRAVFKAQVKALAEGMTGKTWKKIQGELLAIAS